MRLFFLMTLSIIIISCNRDDEPNMDLDLKEQLLEFKIDGLLFKTSVRENTAFGYTRVGNETVIAASDDLVGGGDVLLSFGVFGPAFSNYTVSENDNNQGFAIVITDTSGSITGYTAISVDISIQEDGKGTKTIFSGTVRNTDNEIFQLTEGLIIISSK